MNDPSRQVPPPSSRPRRGRRSGSASATGASSTAAQAAGPLLATALACFALLGTACHGVPSPLTPGPDRLITTVGPLRAGVGRGELTPRVPVPLAGYGARRGALLEGWHDPLWARALVLEAGGLRVAIVSCDLLLIPADLTHVVRRGLPELGIDGLILAATHTHSGPGAYWDNTLAELTALGPYRPAQLASITGAISAALTEAVASLGAARLGIARIDAGDLARNRRVRGGDHDRMLTLVHVEREDATPLAALVHFAAHPTILGADSFLVSADFPGRLCSKLEEAGYRTALFVNGAAGEAATSWPGPERGMERVELVGEALAARALAARRRVDPRPAIRLGWRRTVVRLPPVSSEGPASSGWRWALDPIVRLYCPARTEMSVIDIDDWRLLSMPCDLGILTARRIQQGVPDRQVLCISYANDYIGYVTGPGAFDRNSYEARVSFYGPELTSYLECQACHLLARDP